MTMFYNAILEAQDQTCAKNPEHIHICHTVKEVNHRERSKL